ncbi:lytic transglycosylase domain-containing protein [Ferruginibacter lapsinanis]|uniref:lytic transglycosylase domain-containing protein n=1 Tax=Ferruginibacter lapsinanis TaxID=563172 RepID=UPI001E59336F|nr:lytic transglycosylase domain-containing protein [Ferruginibacter lapsinanis]UEG50643.1 lytic transglycosylase domain-containing protein [Ferruginibacter lapsinanis]
MKLLVKLFVFTAVLCVQKAQANNLGDTTKKQLLADLTTKIEPVYITKPANVSFPEILKGNEEESLSYIQTFSKNRREYIIRMYNKGKKLLPKAAAILKKYNVPQEFKVLLALESAYNPDALSCAGAVGYWQIMDCVANEYGLKYVTQVSKEERKKMMKENPKAADSVLKARAKLKDERKNFNTSTAAAARYLRDRVKNLGNNWLLVAASYNCGVGNVWKAIRQSGKTNPTFWDIKQFLPEETKAYVMNFITLNVLFHNYEKFSKNALTFAPEKILIDNFEQNIMSEMSQK